MGTKFRIGVNTEKEILASPPPPFRHLNLIFTPFAVQVGERAYPAPFWTDFAGVFLFKWYRGILNLGNGQSHAARLPFWYIYEMWLEQATNDRWLLSLAQPENDGTTILHEALVIPEVVEAALLTATQNLLDGARSAGIWTEDCIALDALLRGRESYLADLESGGLPLPAFLSGPLPSPLQPDAPRWETPFKSFLARHVEPGMSPAESDRPSSPRRLVSPPLPCPSCGAVLRAWGTKQTQRHCPQCGNDLRIA